MLDFGMWRDCSFTLAGAGRTVERAERRLNMGRRHGMQAQMIPVLTSARHHKAGKRLVNVEIEKGGHKVLPNWTFQDVKLPE
jgi:hypothetical protein